MKELIDLVNEHLDAVSYTHLDVYKRQPELNLSAVRGNLHVLALYSKKKFFFYQRLFCIGRGSCSSYVFLLNLYI